LIKILRHWPHRGFVRFTLEERINRKGNITTLVQPTKKWAGKCSEKILASGMQGIKTKDQRFRIRRRKKKRSGGNGAFWGISGDQKKSPDSARVLLIIKLNLE